MLDEDPGNDDVEVSVQKQNRWLVNDGVRFPIWVDSPTDCLRRGLIPVRLLDPYFEGTNDWVAEATSHLEPSDDITDAAEFRAAMRHAIEHRDHVKELITATRETVKHFNLPYLRLPASTTKDTALSVFVNMNTNAKPLKPYDIVVAELEGATGKRLKEMEVGLIVQLPRLKSYLTLDSAVLQTAALTQGKLPKQRGYFDIDFALFVANWDQMRVGLARALQVIESMRIFDGDRLPSAIPIPVMAAL